VARCCTEGNILLESLLYPQLPAQDGADITADANDAYVFGVPAIDRQSRTSKAKRAIDVTVASIALIFTLPIIAVAALAIVVTSRGPAIFRQRCVGRDGQHFSIFKLRTMRPGSDFDHQPLLQKGVFEKNVFPVGRFLRRTCLDELPNFINVIRGEMSLVGPRPMTDSEVQFCIERHGKETAAVRLAVKPGMTGLWQVAGREALDFNERVALDVDYAQTWSLIGDMNILSETIPALLKARGAF
jgi:lipopolysaccharide/colanic/teichoic acid biosynthesis glycosyltransferase